MAENRISAPSQIRPPFKMDGTFSQEFYFWLQTISERSLIIGTGAPEGVESASVGAVYMDTTGTTGNILYI